MSKMPINSRYSGVSLISGAGKWPPETANEASQAAFILQFTDFEEIPGK
jgi:hypothetical protein